LAWLSGSRPEQIAAALLPMAHYLWPLDPKFFEALDDLPSVGTLF
jgi:hypothetical protein